MKSPESLFPFSRICSLGFPAMLMIAMVLPVQAALVPIDNVAHISAGESTSCAVNDTGEVLCWGYNPNGQLGTGAPGVVRLPQVIGGFPGPMVAVASAQDHHCALDELGTVWCWGDNDFGQLGDGSTVDRYTPAPVIGLAAAVVAIDVSLGHSCAITTAGALACWGENTFGELGDGTLVHRSTPVFVSSLPAPVTNVSIGLLHTCAITNAQAAWCWGYNGFGQIGNGTTTSSALPQPVSGLGSNAMRIATGVRHACAILLDGSARCWGTNGSGELGDASTISRITPVQVSGFSTGADISLGDGISCARHSDGRIECWGANDFGTLGDGTFERRLTPVPVLGATDFTALSLSYNHACGLRGTGELMCWGDGRNGAIGNGAEAYATQPETIAAAGTSGRQLALGDQHTCLRMNNGSVRCWGGNSVGQVGDGTALQRLSPVSVSGAGSNVAELVSGPSGNCVISSASASPVPQGAVSGELKCWGYNAQGQLGLGNIESSSVPQLVASAGTDVSSIGMGSSHSCIGYGATGFRRCTGSNDTGQSCRVALSASNVYLTCDDAVSEIVATAAGAEHTCALTAGGGVRCWGNNLFGQLGDGTSMASAAAVTPIGLGSGQVQVVTSGYASCALSAGGAVQCWGLNSHGQLGDGTTTNRLSPTSVIGLSSGVTQLAAAGFGTCARSTGGAVRCWGRNASGEVGDGTVTNRLTPVQVIGLTSGVQHIAAGLNHRCALSASGMQCWGDNAYGQFGNGEAAIIARPTAVLVESAEPPFERFADGFEDAP